MFIFHFILILLMTSIQATQEIEGRLLTLNVFMRPPGIKTNQDDYKNERHSDILKLIAGYDIVCFQ